MRLVVVLGFEMQCTSPSTLRREDGLYQEVPCGWCVNCRISKAREWATRVVHEASGWCCSCFITLTYRDEDLPANGSLDFEEFQRFWKRLRKRVGSLKYYACGEYGERTGRPHYHAIVFGLRPCGCRADQGMNEKCCDEDRNLVLKAWGHGGVDRLGTVTMDSARYVADYVGKVLTGDMAVWYGCRQRPFHVMSKGLGGTFVALNEGQLREQEGVTVRGAQVGLPRYYANKLGIKTRRVDEVVPSKVRYSWIGGIPERVVEVGIPRSQRDLDTEARLRLTRKGKV